MMSGSDDAEKLLKKRVNLACASLTAFVAVFELLLLWLVLSADARAKRQADAVLKAVRSSTAVEFSLLPQATDPRLELRRTTRVDAVGVVATGRLIPMLSMDTGRLRFDGWMSVAHNTSLPHDSSSASASGSSAVVSWSESLKTGDNQRELLVLHDQRGARFSSSEDDGLVRCLTPAGVPPLFALEAASGSAFAAQSFANFGVSCKTGRPLEVVFDHLPFVLCALDWLSDLNACLPANVNSNELQSGRFRQVATPPTGSKDEIEVPSTSSNCVKSPPLVIYGERMVLTATLEFGNSVEEGDQQTPAVSTRCGLLEAPLATESLAKLNLLSQMIPRLPLRSNTSVESYMWLPPPI